MSEIKKLKSEIQSLKNLNTNLEKKLNIAKFFLQREIKESVRKINKRKINNSSCEIKTRFANDNLEELITKKIRNYFWDYTLMNISSSIIKNIISAEIAYYNLKQNPNYDGFWVISSYHKALDGIIEQTITKWYRKFAKKEGQIHLRKNNPLEKSLHNVVNKWYILSVWRLFHILKIIKSNTISYDYVNNFEKYLDKYYYLKENLLSNNEFFKIFSKLINTEMLWKKRHSGQINFVDTRKARQYLIWNLKNKNSLIYLLLKSEDTAY